MISAKDNLVSWSVVTELLLATAGVLANAGWWGATLGSCRVMTFRFFDQGWLPSQARSVKRTIPVLAMDDPELRPRTRLAAGLSSAG
jgi:hypothetical protein